MIIFFNLHLRVQVSPGFYKIKYLPYPDHNLGRHLCLEQRQTLQQPDMKSLDLDQETTLLTFISILIKLILFPLLTKFIPL
jgi:hypothetical protein